MKPFHFEKISDYLTIKCVYHQGMVIYHEHDVCDRIGIVLKGKIKMTHYTFQGEERVLATLRKDDIFGDFLINSSRPYYPGDLVALEDSEISFINHQQLESLLSGHSEFRNYFLNQLSEKALHFNLHNKILMQSGLREKINMWMSYQDCDDLGRVPISSKEDLANQLNVARPSLSRELSHMKRDGLIDYDRDFIYIL